MKRLLYILSLSLAVVSCQRRELTYLYDPTCEVVVDVDWSNMSTTPTGMSVYCYPEDGGDAVVAVSNDISSITVNLPQGSYNILVFNQIPTDYGTVSFSGMDSFETAEVSTVSSDSKWAESKSGVGLVRDPEEIAAATYVGFVVSSEDVATKVEYDSGVATKSGESVTKYISVTPKVIIKNIVVRVRVSGIYNHQSTRATLYGLAGGYNFSQQTSHTTQATHVLEDWTKTVYDGYSEGELSITFTSFGLPAQSTTTRSYEDWDGRLDIDILLVDNATITSETVYLNDKVTINSSDDDTKADISADINIDTGFTFDLDSTSDDKPIVLPDVEPVDGSSSGFSAEIDDWGDKVVIDVPI